MPGGDDISPPDEGQRHHHHEAGFREREIDPLKAAFNAIALMSTNPLSARLGLFII